MPERETVSTATRFRPDIEGMRGLAVLVVVFFHCHVPGFGGGFIGVDIFFAHSGYLITGLIVAEIESRGRLSFRNFYARRARRLLPACGLVVISTLLLGGLVYSPLELVRYARWAVYTSVYVSNYMFVHTLADYFSGNVATNPYLHTWSLAVEEQFYLLWPALLSVTFWLGKSRRALIPLLTLIGAVSLILCIRLTYTQQPWAFFSLQARAWEFSFGGLACLVTQEQLATWSRWMRPLGWIGFAAITLSACSFSSAIKFPGFFAVIPIVGAIALLLAGASALPSRLQDLLSSGPLQYLGRLSYSWYLWHWPILILAEACFPEMKWWERLLPALIALGLAQVTFLILENPIRISPFLAVRPALSLSLVLIVGGAGITVANLANRRARSQLASSEQSQLVAASLDDESKAADRCLAAADDAEIRQCGFGTPSSNTTIVLFGDSHAEHWIPALDRIAKQRKWRLLTLLKSGCPVAEVEPYNLALKREYRECPKWRHAAMVTIVNLRPQLVVVSETDRMVTRSHAVVTSNGFANIPDTISPEQWNAGLEATLAYLSERSVKTLLISDTPRADFDVPTCLSRVASHAWAAHDCAIRRSIALNEEARAAETAAVNNVPDVRTVDFANVFCNGSDCNPKVNNQIVYRDSNHLSSGMAALLAPPLEQEIDSFLNTDTKHSNVQVAKNLNRTKPDGSSSH